MALFRTFSSFSLRLSANSSARLLYFQATASQWPLPIRAARAVPSQAVRDVVAPMRVELLQVRRRLGPAGRRLFNGPLAPVES